jgi:hypothetical protein
MIVEYWSIGNNEIVIYTESKDCLNMLKQDFRITGYYFSGSHVVGWHLTVPQRIINLLLKWLENAGIEATRLD